VSHGAALSDGEGTGSASRAEVCAVACAETWRGDGEILASAFGTLPNVGARLARATFEPDLLLSDGEALLVAGTWAIGAPAPATVEGWMPYRAIFDVVSSGRRHVMMVSSQLDRYGNSNISCIGEFAHPQRQLIGVRGAPGNTVQHPTSYWVPRHSRRVFVERVDMISGVGYDSAAAAGPTAQRFMDLRRVVTNLAVLDFQTEDCSMQLVSVHPGVSVGEVIENTSFELAIPPDVPQTRLPNEQELHLIRDVIDPQAYREQEIRA